MLGTIANTGAILTGCVVGSTLKKGIGEKYKKVYKNGESFPIHNQFPNQKPYPAQNNPHLISGKFRTAFQKSSSLPLLPAHELSFQIPQTWSDGTGCRGSFPGSGLTDMPFPSYPMRATRSSWQRWRPPATRRC